VHTPPGEKNRVEVQSTNVSVKSQEGRSGRATQNLEEHLSRELHNRTAHECPVFCGRQNPKEISSLKGGPAFIPKSEPSATSKTPSREFENAKRRASTVDLLPTPKLFALLLLKMTWEPSQVI